MIPFSPSFAEYAGKLILRLHHRWSTPWRAASSFPTHTHTPIHFLNTHSHTHTLFHWGDPLHREPLPHFLHTHTHTHTHTHIDKWIYIRIFKSIDSVLSSASQLSLVFVCACVCPCHLYVHLHPISFTLWSVCVCVFVCVCVCVICQKKEQEKEESTSALTCK